MDAPEKEVTVMVVQAVSDALNTPIDELPPLAETINPDALGAIVSSDSPSDVTVSFSYAGRQVLVREGKTVYVRRGRGQRESRSDLANYSN